MIVKPTNAKPTAEHITVKADCYSASERSWMQLGQGMRAKLLAPLIVTLDRFGVSADQLTALAGVVGLCFVPLWLWNFQVAGLSCIAMHVLLDGLDGPLARHQSKASAQGSFTDTFTDQLVVTAVGVAWMIASPSTYHIAVGSLYIFLYALVVMMSMVRNALAIPYSWLVRPRFLVYAALLLDVAFNLDSSQVVIGVCDLLLAWKAVTGFVALRGKIPYLG